jgi:hypothetical protein
MPIYGYSKLDEQGKGWDDELGAERNLYGLPLKFYTPILSNICATIYLSGLIVWVQRATTAHALLRSIVFFFLPSTTHEADRN